VVEIYTFKCIVSVDTMSNDHPNTVVIAYNPCE